MGNLFLYVIWILAWSAVKADVCVEVDRKFIEVADSGLPACNCFTDDEHTVTPWSERKIWIGCSGFSMSRIFSELYALNHTAVNRVQIWDSMLNIIPAEMFQNVHPHAIMIERSLTTVVRQGTFSSIGGDLRYLTLRNNAFKKTLDSEMFRGLINVQHLDLSGNKLTSIKKSDFELIPNLRELLLNDNAITTIDPDAFSNLAELKVLSIQGNQLNKITSETFRGLHNLEELLLNNNEISFIAADAFTHLKKLRVLNLERNHITAVTLNGLKSLEKLFISSNAITSLNSLELSELPSLGLLILDRNELATIGETSFKGLSDSASLHTFSCASNNISIIGTGAFKYLSQLRNLALQNNAITALSINGHPIFAPLKHLETLLLSNNRIETIEADQLPKSLRTIALDNNSLTQISSAAFSGMQLRQLFLQENLLTHLPLGTFDSIDFEILDSIDVSSNRWQCVCEEEWLGSWLDLAGDRDVGEGPIGCLAMPPCNQKEKDAKGRTSSWIVNLAYILTFVTVAILIAIVIIVVDDERAYSKGPLRRRDSDMLGLIAGEAKTDADRGVSSVRRSNNAPARNVRFTT